VTRPGPCLPLRGRSGPPEWDWERRAPWPEPSEARVEEMLRPVLGRGPFALEPLSGGLSSGAYRVAGAPVVLRICPRGTAAVEAALLAHAADAGVPAPRVLAAGGDHLVLTWIEGARWADRLHEGATDALAAARSAGRTLARIHAVQLDAAGLLQVEEGRLVVRPRFAGGPGEALATYTFDELGGPAGARLGAERADAVRSLLERRGHLLDPSSGAAVLCHGDYKPTNLLSRGDGISGVLDWEFAWSGTPLADLGQLLRWDDRYPPGFAAAVAEGYGPLPADWEIRAALADLANMVGFLGGPEDRPHVHRDARDRIGRTLDRAG
jgi:aminoglycoside phosphotransferase (APT) family kinase protein